VIECICGDGTTIPPLVIFKGQNLQTAWIPKDMMASWKFTCNTKGWTSDRIGEEWFTQCFESVTSAKANGKK
jgi:frataxin-like iron-binding protein CyaY